jgi:hypothetical protein
MNEATPTNYFFLFLDAVFFIACLSRTSFAIFAFIDSSKNATV